MSSRVISEEFELHRDTPLEPRPLRLLTNRSWLGGRRIGETVLVTEEAGFEGLRGLLRRVTALKRADAALIDCAVAQLLLLCAVKSVLPGLRCKIIAVDMVLTRPRGIQATVKFWFRRWLLRVVDAWIFYYKDTSALEEVYKIPASKVRFVPFKPNTRDLLLETPISDEGYFLACGRSNRDYRSLIAAFTGLPHRCVILAPWESMGDEITSVQGIPIPPNVSLARDDGTPESWNRWIAGSTGVILPIEPGMLSPSGIGTYLVAMALGKPVVITDGPATRGLIDSGEAMIVPPSDPRAIASAVTKLADDIGHRQEVGERGRRYALSLEGEERLRADLLLELKRVLHGP